MLPATSNEGIEERFCSPFKFDHRLCARGHRDRRKRQRHARPSGAGISRRVVSANVRDRRLQQVAAPLQLPLRIDPEGASGTRAKADIEKPEAGMRAVLDALPDNDDARSPFALLMTLCSTLS